MFVFLLTLAAATAAGFPAEGNVTTGTDIGDQLYRAYTSIPKSVPEATEAGWSSYGAFDANLGEPYSEKSGGPKEKRPVTLYFGKSGQISGVGVDIWGEVKNALKGTYFYKTSRGTYHIAVSFRNPQDIASTDFSDHRLGDQLVINQGNLNEALPLTEDDAKAQQFQRGACFWSMGYHYFQDITTRNGTLTWYGENLLPVVPMYSNGVINAFFFASTDVQQAIFPPNTNEWEPVALPNAGMCQNFCNKDCTWKDTYWWSTMHFYTRNYKEASCPGICAISCCS